LVACTISIDSQHDRLADVVIAPFRQLLPFMALDFYNKISDEDLELIVEYIKMFPPSQATPPVPE
jgi:hypothetical protein